MENISKYKNSLLLDIRTNEFILSIVKIVFRSSITKDYLTIASRNQMIVKITQTQRIFNPKTFYNNLSIVICVILSLDQLDGLYLK